MSDYRVLPFAMHAVQGGAPVGLHPDSAALPLGAAALGAGADRVAVPFVTSLLINPATGNPFAPPLAADNSDALAALGALVPTLTARLLAWDGAQYVRPRAITDNADAQAAAGALLLGTVARLQAWNGATFDRVRSELDNQDDLAALGRLLATVSRPQLWDGAAYARQHGTMPLNLLLSAVRAATTASADQINRNGRGLHVILDITAVPGVQTVTLSIEADDPNSGVIYTLLTGAAEVAIATRVYRLYPGLTAVANATVNDVLPYNWRVRVTHSGAGNFTYSVGASVIL